MSVPTKVYKLFFASFGRFPTETCHVVGLLVVDCMRCSLCAPALAECPVSLGVGRQVSEFGECQLFAPHRLPG